MTLYAIERIDDAASLARSLLFPVDGWLWAKLAVVVALVGLGSGGSGFEGVFSNASSSAGGAPTMAPDIGEITLPENVLVLVGLAVASMVLIGLLLGVVGAIMEFVLVTALRDREIAIRKTARRHVRQGLGLFGFRLLLGLLVLVFVGGSALVLFAGEITTVLGGETLTIEPASAFARGLLVGLVALLIGLPVALAHGLTTEFVVPVMLKTGHGVLAGWKRFLPTLRGEVVQYGVYVLIAFVLRIVTSLAAGIVLSIVAVIALIPFAVVGVVLGAGTLASGTVSAATVALFVLLGLAYLVVLAPLAGVVYVPVRAFHRYHALLVLGDTDVDLDVIEEIRPPLSGDQA